MKTRLSKEKFIVKAMNVHGEDKYDYSNILYQGMSEKIFILCKKCGKFFEQRASNHINQKSGCPDCKPVKPKLTETNFINRIDKNLELLSKYEGLGTKVKVSCKKCGRVFDIFTNSILRGHTCQCIKKGIPHKIINTEEFTKKVKDKYGNQFDLSKVEYKGHKEKILVKCNICQKDIHKRADSFMRGKTHKNCLNIK